MLVDPGMALRVHELETNLAQLQLWQAEQQRQSGKDETITSLVKAQRKHVEAIAVLENNVGKYAGIITTLEQEQEIFKQEQQKQVDAITVVEKDMEIVTAFGFL